MKKILLVIDMQNDFINGALGTKEAVSIVGNVVKKIKEHESKEAEIIFTMDTHDEEYLETQEGKNLPVEHCIKGTYGWELHPEIKQAIDISRYRIYEKGTFGSDNLAKDLFEGKYKDIDQIEIVGVATDICVLTNAILTKTFMPETLITVDASCCAGVTPKSHKTALQALKPIQIEIINE